MDWRKFCFWTAFILMVAVPSGQGVKTRYELGVMKFNSSGSSNALDLCFNYPPKYFTVPTVLSESYAVKDLTDINPCGNDTSSLAGASSVDNTVFLMLVNPECQFSDYARYPISHHGKGLILIAGEYLEVDGNYSMDVFALIGNKTGGRLMDYLTEGKLEVQFITESNDPTFNPSVLVLWAMAFFCVAVASYTGPYRDFSGTINEQQILDSSATSTADKTPKINMNVIVTLVLVVFITATLLLLYFFYKYLVYVFMAIFCFATARATYDLWTQVLKYFKLDSCTPKIKGYGIHQILLLLICIAVPIVWFFYRKTTVGWILQDYLGICFCIHLIQTLRMPNLKICTILLSLLFVYDIFFVFITPFFTSDGESVMVHVATGGGSGENLPLLLQVPSLKSSLLSMCTTQSSMLGFGDIIVPGFLVCFAHCFDVYNGQGKPYFITALIGYGIGLAIAFVVLTLSQTGQPALFYIVPCTLIPIYIVGLCKKQVKQLWYNPDPAVMLQPSQPGESEP